MGFFDKNSSLDKPTVWDGFLSWIIIIVANWVIWRSVVDKIRIINSRPHEQAPVTVSAYWHLLVSPDWHSSKQHWLLDCLGRRGISWWLCRCICRYCCCCRRYSLCSSLNSCSEVPVHTAVPLIRHSFSAEVVGTGAVASSAWLRDLWHSQESKGPKPQPIESHNDSSSLIKSSSFIKIVQLLNLNKIINFLECSICHTKLMARCNLSLKVSIQKSWTRPTSSTYSIPRHNWHYSSIERSSFRPHNTRSKSNFNTASFFKGINLRRRDSNLVQR